MVLIGRRPSVESTFPEDGFRPLAGIMVLIITSRIFVHVGITVSVPLRGLWFLSRNGEITMIRHYWHKFPSPCGDYGSYRRQHCYQVHREGKSFRPLAGIMVLIIGNHEKGRHNNIKVSVPLRGLWFLSKHVMHTMLAT